MTGCHVQGGRRKLASAVAGDSRLARSAQAPIGGNSTQAKTTKWTTAMRKQRSFADDLVKGSNRPLLPFEIGPVNEREARESGRPLEGVGCAWSAVIRIGAKASYKPSHASLVMHRASRGSRPSVERRRRRLLVVVRTERLLLHGVEAVRERLEELSVLCGRAVSKLRNLHLALR